MRSKQIRGRGTRPKQSPLPSATNDTAARLALAIQEALPIHQAGELEAAERIYRQILTIQPNHPDALHLLGFIFHQRGQEEMAAESIGKAVEIAPDRPIFLNNLGIVLGTLGRKEEAISCYQRALKIQPDFYMALGNLGGILADQGQRESAIDCFHKALAIKPDSYEILNSLGNVLIKAGNHPEAITCYQKAIRLQPHLADAYNGMGTALRDQGNHDEAIACLKKGLDLHPNHFDMLNGMGNALLAQGKMDEALANFEKALKINPNHPNTYHNMGGALRSQGKFAEATQLYEKALAINPNLHQTYNSLGNVLHEQDRLAEAVACYQKSLSIQPNDPDTLNNIAIIQTDQGNLLEAIDAYKKVVELSPRNLNAQCDVINLLLYMCDWQGMETRYQQMMALFPVLEKETSPFVFLALPTTPAEQRRGAELYMRNKYPQRDNMTATRAYDPQPQRIKIGYLSSDFQNHPVAYLTAELFELHDRNRFEITAYSYGPDDGREMRRRIMAASDHFVDLRPLTYPEGAQRILDDGIHILMDLNGFTKNARIQILALRPAPIQASWLGYLGTLGAPFIDYLISDTFITPPGCEADFTEKLVRMPECFQPNDRQRVISERTPTRQERGLPETGFIFASFNKSYKINPTLWDAWMAIMRQTPGSLLWLVTDNRWVEGNLRREAEARGVQSNRLYFVQKMPLADYLANYRLVDLVLDTHPYNSGTTASNALWAGCPMLTYAGKTFVSRQAGSLLRTVGLPELVTHSLDEYVALAVELAHNPARLAAMRQRLQANRLTSPLFDSPRFTKHLESAYEAMWHRFQTGSAPDHIEVARIPDPDVAPSQAPAHPPSVQEKSETTTEAKPATLPPITQEMPPKQPLPAAKVETDPVSDQAASAARYFHEAMQHHRAGALQTAETLYLQALAHQPNNPEILYQMGILAHQQGQPDKTVEWISQAIAANPNQPLFLHSLGIVWAERNEQQKAIDSFQKVLAIQPNHPDALYQLGNCLRKQNKHTEAMACYRQAIALQPALYDAHLCLGNLLRTEGKIAEAIACYRKTIEIYPNHQNAYTNLGSLLAEQGDTTEAIACYRQALKIQPTLCEAWNGLGNTLRENGEYDEAIIAFQQAVAINPTYHVAYVNMGIVLNMQGKATEEIACYEKALAIQPDSHQTYFCLGSAMTAQNRHREAIDYFQKALAINPDFYQAHTGLGSAFSAQDRMDEAVASYQAALALSPDDVGILKNLGIVLTYQGRWAEALTHCQRAVERAPNQTDLQCKALHCALQISDWQDFQPRYLRMMQTFHAEEQEASLFVFLALPTSPEEQKRCAELFVKNRYKTRGMLSSAKQYAPNPDRLKIGYLSFDFKNHPGGYVAAELFAHHNRENVEVIAYSYNTDDGSTLRQQIMAACDRFVDLHALSHQEAAQRICDDGVHILVDLNGLTQGARIEISAFRPAPIQALYLGAVTSLGAPFFDYCITGEYMAPPGSESFFSEKLVRLPYFFQPRRKMAPTTPTRQSCGLPEKGFVFSCFNQPYKINPPLFDIWMRLLQQTEGSVLWLREFNPWSTKNLRREAEQRGVDGNRLIFAPTTPELADHVARYALADLTLDTFPYTSGSTGWDALSAGCPMVTCAGAYGMARVGANLLIHVGLPDLVTDSLEAYEALALTLTQNPIRLANIRRQLQKNTPTARLFDASQFAKHLENAYKTMWHRFQSGQAPDHIHITAKNSSDNHKQKKGVTVETGTKKTASVTPKTASGAVKPATLSLELLMQQGLEHHRAGRLAEAETLYHQILTHHPNNADTLHLLGHLCHQRGESHKAAEWISKAVAANPNQPVFLYNLSIIWIGLGNLPEAVHCLQKVLALQPTHHDALYHMGNCLRDQKKTKEAKSYYQQAIAIQPNLFDAHNSLGNLYLGEGKIAEAIVCYRKTVEIYPNHQNAYTNLGNALSAQGNTAEAIRYYQKALEIQPTLCEAYNGLGSTLQKEGRLDEAIACFQRALAVNPNFHSAYHNQGITLQLQGKLTEAIESYKKVLTIQPNAPETYNNLGSALVAAAKIPEAIEYYKKALEVQPTFYQAYGNLGIAHQKMEDLTQAITYYQKALDICPTDRSSLSNLAFALQLQGEVAKSIACYQRVLDMYPDDPEAHGSVLHQMLQVCDWTGFQSRYDQMMAAFHASGNREVNAFIFLSVPTTPEEQYACSVISANHKYAIQGHMAATRSYDLNPPRLKIGYLSADYQDHATTHLIAELFELHDRNRFEIIAYSYGQDDGLSMRKRVVAACEHFVDLRHFSHQDSAQRILDDGCHILLELKGYTKDSRLEIPALRPAPIQCSWLGYPGTVGASFIDYIITDPFVTPHGFESHYTEKIVRLDSCYQPNDRKRPIVPQTPTREACGLPEEGFIFACFNKNYKINPPIFDIWMRLLQKTPGSLLWLFESNQWVIDNLRREAQNRGVEPSRLFFAPKMPPAQHIARYRLANLVLDTFPYTSHTTGSDALWAGAPLLTYAGQTFASRVAGSLLTYMDMPELITYSLAEYEARALELAHDPAQLAAICQKIAAHLPTAPLFDSPRFTRSLEAAYEAMWRRFQAGEAPDHIDVHLGTEKTAPPSAVAKPRATSKKGAQKTAQPSAQPKAAPQAPSVAQLLSQARSLNAKGSVAEALSLYTQILVSDPSHADALYGSAIALGAQGAVEEGLVQLAKAKTLAPNKPELESAIQPLVLQAGALYNAHLKANRLEQAAHLIELLSQIAPHNIFVQEQALTLFKKLERHEQALRVAKTVFKLNSAHFVAHQILVEDCMARKDRQGELAYRIDMARRHPRAIHTAFHLQDVYMSLSALLLTPLDDQKVSTIEALLALAQTIITDNPVAEDDPLYHSYMFYHTSIEALNIQAVIRPPPPPAPWPAIQFASATGETMALAAVSEKIAQQKAELIFYIAADPVYIAQHARRYVSYILNACDVPFVIIAQVVGGMNQLSALAPAVGIADQRLIFAADGFKPESVRAVTWKIHEKTPIRSPLVYYQSARFLWLDYLMEQFNLPVLVSDIDQLLQRGIKEMLTRFAQSDVVCYEALRNHKMADRFLAGLLLVKPTQTGRQFAQFFRYYMELALQNAEKRGSYAYFLDQNALLMARHHLLWTSQEPRIGYFDPLDMNVSMFQSFQKNPFLFFTFYSGFDMKSLPDFTKP